MNKEIIALKDAYKDYFNIGAAVNPNILENDSELVKTHFNSVTSENAMKFESLQPEPNKYTFEVADSMVAFAKENNINYKGHTLVWHNQTPDWVFQNEDGSQVNREQLLKRMKNHINKVLTHYDDPIFKSWDVVNEVIEDHSNDLLRKSPWFDIIGDDFIEQAFWFAHEVNPDVDLYYNDYNESIPEKREKIYTLVKGLLGKDTPIDGIGLQAHWNLEKPSLDHIRQAIERYASLGLKLQITEMDVSVFSHKDKRTDLLSPTDEMLEKQAERYQAFFELFREYHEHIDTVTFWGASDRYSWLNDFPVKGRKNWPFVLDEKGNPKKSYQLITDF